MQQEQAAQLEPAAQMLAGLLDAVRADPEVLGQAVAAARAKGRPAKALPEHEVLRHIYSLLDAVIAMLRMAPEDVARATAAADELAVDRARQGVALEVLLDGVLSARSVVLTAVLEASAPVMTSDQLLPLLIRLDGAASVLQNRMIVEYQRAEQDLGRTRRQAHVEALRELLDGGSLRWAQEAGLDPGGVYHCLVIDVSTPSQARRLEPLFDPASAVSGLVHGYLCAVTPRLPAPDRLGAVLTVTSPPVAVDQLSTAHTLCREALSVCQVQGRTGVQSLTGNALVVSTAARPVLGRMLCDELLQRLDPAEEFHRLLARTALTYLVEGNRTERTAGVLHVHPNTVKYRIRRFAELTGMSDEPDPFGTTLAQSVNWWWALSVWLADTAEPGHEA